MKKLTKLPSKWAVKVTDKNKDILTKWVKSHKDFDKDLLDVKGKVKDYYVVNKHDLDRSYQLWNDTCEGYTKITFEDFKRLVLKETKTPIMKQEKYKIGDIIKPVDGWADGVVCKLVQEKGDNFISDYKVSGIKQHISVENIKRLATEKEIENYKNNIMKKEEPKPFTIKGKEHQIRSIFQDLKELGYFTCKKGSSYSLDNVKLAENALCVNVNLITNLEEFKELVAIYDSNKKEIFNLPQDYSKALEFAKQQIEHPYWKKKELPVILGYFGTENGNIISYGCRSKFKSQYKALYKIMQEFDIKSYKIEAGEVKFEEIEQINNYLTKK